MDKMNKKKVKKKSSNPLYIVTNKGKDVEMILAPWLVLWKNLQAFLKNLQGYMGLIYLQKFLEEWIVNLKILLENSRSFFEIILRTLIPSKPKPSV